MRRNNKGITLIALIVTIIVLIIIAGVSIATLTADNGILRQVNSAKVSQIEGTAREQVKLACAAMRLAIAEASAKDNSYSAVEHANAIQEELLATIKADNTSLDDSWESSTASNGDTSFTITYKGQDYKNACNDDNAEIVYTIGLSQRSIEITNETNSTLKDQNGNDVVLDIGSNEGTGSSSGSGSGSESGDTTGTKIADVVEVGDYINYGAKLTSKTYDTDTDETGYSVSQKFQTNTSMSWRVISKNSDGSVNIVATQNVLATDNATGLYLSGQTGFLNAETVLKELCDELYTNSSYGEARSINDSDINGLTGFDPETSEWTGNEDMKSYYGTSYSYTSGGPFWDKSSNTFKTPTTINAVTVMYDLYVYTVDTSMPLYDTLIYESTTYTGDGTETNYPLFYWLCSNCASANNSGSSFGVRAVYIGEVYGNVLFGASISDRVMAFEYANAVRPIVTLTSEVLVDTSNTEKDGASASTAYELK